MSDLHKPRFPSGAGGVWFGPALAALIAVLLIWKPFESKPAQEDVLFSAGPHLEGVLEVSTKSRVLVNLGPLNEDLRRQAFDKVALSRRLDLPEGEPWRLRLAAEGEAPKTALLDVQISDSEGTCLSPIIEGVAPSGGGVKDPLVGLFQTHEVGGEVPRWEVVLWGRPPGLGGRLECSWGSVELEALVVGGVQEDNQGSGVHPSRTPSEDEDRD